MEAENYVIMLKNNETGFLEKEIASCRLESWGGYLGGIHAEDESGGRYLHLKLTTADDVKDWEYAAIFDYYDEERLSDRLLRFAPDAEGYNPAWDCVLPFEEDTERMQEAIIAVIKIHACELDEVMEAISGLEAEYDGHEQTLNKEGE